MVRSDIMKKSSKRKKKPMNRNLKVFLVSFASFMALGIIVTGLIVYFAAINSVDYINYSSLGLDFQVLFTTQMMKAITTNTSRFTESRTECGQPLMKFRRTFLMPLFQ